jgi:hypothetical protein
MNELVNSPTPGRPEAASEVGSRNNAKVMPLIDNFVTSYLTKDLNSGLPLVVNITDSGSQFAHGYTARMVRDGVAHTYGEGNSVLQSRLMFGVASKLAFAYINDYVWGTQMRRMAENQKSRSQCGCE